jgi:hypothetical protein
LSGFFNNSSDYLSVFLREALGLFSVFFSVLAGVVLALAGCSTLVSGVFLTLALISLAVTFFSSDFFSSAFSSEISFSLCSIAALAFSTSISLVATFSSFYGLFSARNLSLNISQSSSNR